MDGVFSFISNTLRRKGDIKNVDTSEKFANIYRSTVLEKVSTFNNTVQEVYIAKLFHFNCFFDDEFEKYTSYLERIKNFYQRSTPIE